MQSQVFIVHVCNYIENYRQPLAGEQDAAVLILPYLKLCL